MRGSHKSSDMQQTIDSVLAMLDPPSAPETINQRAQAEVAPF